MPRILKSDKLMLPLVLGALVLAAYWPVFTGPGLPGGEMSDTIHQGYPFFDFTMQALRDGRIPHWNPLIFCGVPFFSSFSAPVFYPLRGLPMLLAGAEATIRFTFPAHMFLGGLFAWLFLGAAGAGRPGRWLGTVAFAATCWSNTLFYAGHGSKIICWSYLPLLLYACERWRTARRLSFVALGGFCFGMMALSSHPQMLLYSAMASATWLLVQALLDRRPLRPLALSACALAAMLLLGAGIGAVQLLPGYNFSRYSTRGSDLSQDQAASYSLPPEESLTMILPHLYGYRHGFPDSQVAGVPVYWGRLGLRLSSEFLGVSVFFLAILGLASGGPRARVPLLVLAAAGLLVSWGGYTPVYRVLYAVAPVFRKLRAPHMAAFLTTSSLALASGLGLDALLRSGRKIWRIPAAASAAFVAMSLLAPGIASGSLSSSPAPGGRAVLQGVVQVREDMIRSDFLKAGAALALVAAGAWAAPRRKGSVPAVAAGLCLLAAVELIPVDRDFQVLLPASGIRDAVGGRPDLAALAGGGRVLPGGNDLMCSGIRSVAGYHAARPQVTEGMMQALSSGGILAARMTAWTVLDDSVPMTYSQVRGEILGQLVQSGMDPDSAGALLPEGPLPRAFVTSAWVVAGEDQALQAITAGYDQQAMSVLDSDPGLARPTSSLEASAEIVADLPESVAVRARLSEPSVLVLADTWYPRWRAFVDGRPAGLLRANYWQRAVAVPAGEHLVSFVFDSGDVSTGLALSICSAVAACALAAADLLGRRKKVS